MGTWQRSARRVGPLALAAAACIIPDKEIVIEGEFANRGAIRIVEPLPVSGDADLACDLASKDVTACPQVPSAGLIPSGVIGAPLCVCPEGSADDQALGEIRIYAEDPDRDQDGNPKDDLFAALLLDFDAFSDLPQDAVAYRNYLQPDRPGELVASAEYENSLGRPSPRLRFFRIVGPSGVVDLCNDNEGDKLAPGPHTLKLIATDRPWFTPVKRDEEGKPVVDPATGEPILLPQEIGTPDLAAGATYDTISWVFVCGDDESCNCSPVEP